MCARVASGPPLCVGGATPTPLASPADIAQLAAGNVDRCAVTSAGALWCWGMNEYGEVGDGTRESREQPVAVRW